MKLIKSILLLLLFAVLIGGCMMTPWGMGGMGSMGGMHGSDMSSEGEFELNTTIIENNYSLKLEGLISEMNGNSKFFISLENMSTGREEIDFYSEMSLYRIPFQGSPMTEILKNSIVEKLPFDSNGDGVQYLNFPLITAGEYYSVIKVKAIDGSMLDYPLLFKYRFNYEPVKNTESKNEFLGINYWLWGAVMAVTMGVMMFGFGFYH